MAESKARVSFDRQYFDRIVSAQAMVNTQTNYDVRFYDVYIRVNDTTKILYGKVGCVANAMEPSVSQVQVDLFDNMVVDSIVGPTGILAYSRATNVVTVTLDRAYNTGETFSFFTYYHGHPIEGGFQAFSFSTRSGKKIISSLSQPYYSRTWWPCKDRNDDKADSFKICIEVDTSLYCGSNGSLDSVVSSSANTKRFFYTEHYPMVTYLFSVAISPYTVWHQYYKYNSGADSMLITHAVYSDRYAYSLPTWGITPTAIGYLSSYYGQYPYIAEKYGHSNFPWNGGMEHQTMTSMVGDGSFGFAENVVVHELSHQWVGDLITCKSWHDIWLNEGWATYSEALYHLSKEGWSGYHMMMDSMDWDHSGSIYVTDTTSVGAIFSRTVYDKGGWFVHMLRRVIGHAKFQQLLDAYFSSQFRFGSLTTTEFKDLAESVTGVELDWFFDEWLYSVKRPNYNWAYTTVPAAGGGYDTWVLAKQVQTNTSQIFDMPIDFAFDYDGHPTDSLTLQINGKRSVQKVHTTYEPIQLSFDPRRWVLKYATQLDWGARILSTPASMTVGQQYKLYRDTLEILGGTGPYDITFPSGALPAGLTINDAAIIAGTPTDTGTFSFTISVRDMSWGYTDQMNLSIRIAPAVLIPGDVNFSQVMVDLSDLSALVSFLTGGGYVPPMPRLADVNNDCVIDLSDLSRLVSYLTGGGATLALGCAN